MTHHEHVTADHVEYAPKDPAATRRFLESVFGWKLEKREGEAPEIWLFKAENGPGGWTDW
jgi:predicted enzyme related to lactoylglutathione lyase